MKLVMVPAALEELQSAAAFYVTSANLELGRAFIAEFERTSNLLLVNPHIGNLFRGTRRRYALRRFPYDLIYQLTPDELRIVAIAHQRRRPGYWKVRR